MTALRPARLTALAAAFHLAACAAPPPGGLEGPVASEAGKAADSATPAPPGPSGGQLAALRVELADPPPGLLDDEGAGVLTLRREGERHPIRLVFVNGALGAYALESGIYRVERIAGYDCGKLYLILVPRAAPLSLGGLELADTGEHGARLSGRLPTPEDLERIAALVGTDAAAIEVEPLTRGQNLVCTRDPRAVSRPDIDPNIRKLTPGEIAGVVLLGGILGAATGYGIAAGSFIFASGTGGGLIFVGI